MVVLAGPRGADDRHRAALGNREADVLEHRRIFAVLEAHVVETDAVFESGAVCVPVSSLAAARLGGHLVDNAQRWHKHEYLRLSDSATRLAATRDKRQQEDDQEGDRHPEYVTAT